MKDYLWVILIVVLIAFAACGPQTELAANVPQITGIQAWIDAPLPGTTIPLEPYTLIFHGADEEGVEEFEVYVNGIQEVVVPVQPSMIGDGPVGTLYFGVYDWTPPAIGTYLIEIYARNQRSTSNPAPVQITVVLDKLLPLKTATVTPPNQEPPPPTDTPTPEPAKQAKQCIFIAKMGLNCRKGPAIIYDYVDSFVAGQSALVVGSSAAGYHWYVEGPNNGQVCAVSNAERYGYTEGDCGEQPRFTPGPTPTFTPEPTATDSPQGCTVRRPGVGIVCVYPCPRGAVPGEPCDP